MRRTVAELILLASITGQVLYWVWCLLVEKLTWYGDPVLATGLVLVPYGALALFALWRLWKRTSVGAMACIAFYLLQIVSFTFGSGKKFGFYTPTIFIRLNSDAAKPVNLNLIALL